MSECQFFSNDLCIRRFQLYLVHMYGRKSLRLESKFETVNEYEKGEKTE